MPICVLKRGDLCVKMRPDSCIKQNGRQPRFVPHAFAQDTQHNLHKIRLAVSHCRPQQSQNKRLKQIRESLIDDQNVTIFLD